MQAKCWCADSWPGGMACYQRLSSLVAITCCTAKGGGSSTAKPAGQLRAHCHAFMKAQGNMRQHATLSMTREKKKWGGTATQGQGTHSFNNCLLCNNPHSPRIWVVVQLQQLLLRGWPTTAAAAAVVATASLSCLWLRSSRR